MKQWAPGRTGYYWYLTFDDADLIELAAECQQALAIGGSIRFHWMPCTSP
ncbi:hypothetical protein OG308_12885 [Nocardia salmonicida]|uniref:Uncharacterized protein n=1 Tax=Nocardia salmonicida TaxID=53431 RepID=A0ABZ1NF56_9NOCA